MTEVIAWKLQKLCLSQSEIEYIIAAQQKIEDYIVRGGFEFDFPSRSVYGREVLVIVRSQLSLHCEFHFCEENFPCLFKAFLIDDGSQDNDVGASQLFLFY